MQAKKQSTQQRASSNDVSTVATRPRELSEQQLADVGGGAGSTVRRPQ